MGLSAQNVAIVPTPSGILDGHFPDGNDGTAGIPLTWATVPSFLQKQVGTPFSVDLFTLYLTQAGSPAATATVSVGALSGGWSLNSAGVLSYSGSGQGTGTIKVRATRLAATSDSNFFTFESIATIVSGDTLPPTIPTNPMLISDTTTTVTVTSDVPADVPTSLIPASGYKETRWFKEGVIDGTSSFTPGLLQRLTKLDVANAGGARKLRLGHYVAISETNVANAGGVPNPTHVWDTGPICNGVQGLVIRYRWKELETGASGGTYLSTSGMARLRKELGQCSASAANGGTGVMLVAMLIVRDFTAPTAMSFTTNVKGQVTGTISPGVANGSYGGVFTETDTSTSPATVTDVIRNPVIVTASTGTGAGTTATVTWTGALPTGATITINSADAIPATDNPMPTYLNDKASPFHSGVGVGGGWQGWRWDSTVINRFDLLVKALGAADAQDPLYPGFTFDQHPNFAGFATQETSNGSTTDGGYSQAAYQSALIAESNSISNACPNSRHWFYFNFMNGNATTGTSALLAVAAAIWQNGALVGGPDLVTAGNIVTSRCYPNYKKYHDGTAGGAQTGAGYTFCGVQNAEWTGIPPSDGNHPMEQLAQWGMGSTTLFTQPNPLKLDCIVWDWHVPANGLNESFSNTMPTVMVNHPAPFGTLSAPSGGLATGSVVQTNTDYSVTSFGTGINTTDDQWTAANNSVNGNVTVIVKLASLTGTDLTSNPTMGVCIRDASGPIARAVYLVATSTQLRSRYRISPSASVAPIIDIASQGWNVPKYLKITRVGDLFSFFYSIDTLTWTAVGTVTLHMVPIVYIQLFAGSTGTSAVTGTFQQVNVQQLSKINYTFTGLTTATTYHFTAVGRDLANNDSAASATLTVTTP